MFERSADDVDRGSGEEDGCAQQAALIHREILQLGALILIAVAGFFLTRAVAASNRDIGLRDAAEWYTRGQHALQTGRVDVAIDAFRRAAIRNRGNKDYVLALARALAVRHDDDSARSVLLALRESAPEDADVNLELARLAARRHDVTEALRFYYHALYAPWPPELRDARRRVRLELIRLLLTHNQPARATSELVAVAGDLPETAAAHVEVGQLFAAAGDYPHALDQFQRALRCDPDDGAALAGAGHSAFQSGHYLLALHYLRRAPGEVGDVAETRAVAELVLAADPLATRIGSAERRRRLISDLAYAGGRLATCTPPGAGGQTGEKLAALQTEAGSLSRRLEQAPVLEQDDVDAGMELLARMTQHLAQSCSPRRPRDRALILIARQYAGDRR